MTESEKKQALKKILSTVKSHKNVKDNIERSETIKAVLENNEAIASKNGTIATWTPQESTGRSPKDTYIVKREESQKNVDWKSANNNAIDEDTFNLVLDDALSFISKRENIYITDRVIGADSKYALPVKTISCHALTSLFSDNMFRPVPEDIKNSVFNNDGFTLLSLPYNKLDKTKYKGRLRKLANGKTSDMFVAMDLDRKIGLIVGSAYLGSVKKLLFTVMNYYTPLEGILPLHCSANEGKDGNSALLLGLSGTGKTTLSADPNRALLGDDEHGWGNNGIANFENGCYAKMIDLDEESEPEIYNAVLHKDDILKHGVIVENAMIYPNGKFDFFDNRLTPNSRASYPLKYLSNIKESSTSGHPKTILFLTADAYGVLPPISKLDINQARLWFLMGYTSKLAGTETGITKPEATFSRFFGQPFMPVNPDVYSSMLGEKMRKHKTQVFLINTGWSGGSYGTGKRIKLKYTRAMVDAALSGELNNIDYVHDDLFHVNIPRHCPGVPLEILTPKNTWENKEDYIKTANKLAREFSTAFDLSYGESNIDENVRKQCPGK